MKLLKGIQGFWILSPHGSWATLHCSFYPYSNRHPAPYGLALATTQAELFTPSSGLLTPFLPLIKLWQYCVTSLLFAHLSPFSEGNAIFICVPLTTGSYLAPDRCSIQEFLFSIMVKGMNE